MNTGTGHKAAPVTAAWVCLGLAWVLFILPIPFLSGAAGWVLNLVAFILAIVVMTRGRARAGLMPLLASLIVSPIIYFIGLAVLAGTVDAMNTSKQAGALSTQEAVVSKEESPADAPTQAPDLAIVVSASELYAAYDRNEIAADQQYKGKRLEVSGVVESIDSDFDDKPQVNISADGLIGFVQAGDLPGNVAAGLGKGQHITVACTGAGEVMSFPVLKDCELL